MSFQGDPYRILGLVPGASLNEIRSAYRRLAKQFHPDAAGERALPRFLAIQAAYEQLVDAEGMLRPVGGAARRARPTASSGASSRADPARARATRDAWRARARTAGSGSAGADRDARTPGARPDATGASRGTDARDAHAGGRPADGGAQGYTGGGSGQERRSRGDDAAGGRRPLRVHRKATPGSTSYDEAAEPVFEPDWDGSSWYGPMSRTFWTINPREYADPRKHGPEYQARAHRAGDDGTSRSPGARTAAGAGPAAGAQGAADAADRAAGGAGDGAAAGDAADGAAASAWRWSGAGPTMTEGADAAWGTRGWTYDTGEPPATPRRRSRGTWTSPPRDDDEGENDGTRRRGVAGRAGRSQDADAAHSDAAHSDAADVFPDLEALARRASPASLRALAARGDPRGRLLLALVAWPPLGFAAGTFIDILTGCASFSVRCPPPLPLLPLAIQPVVLGSLFVAPALAAVAAFATLGALAVALPLAAVLSVGSIPEARVGATVLAVVVAIAYLVALAASVVAATRASGRRRSRRSRPPGAPLR